jgi:hypothetical protein
LSARLSYALVTPARTEEENLAQPIPVTLGHARGAARAYRRECLEQLLPLVERVGWDSINGWKAALHGYIESRRVQAA